MISSRGSVRRLRGDARDTQELGPLRVLRTDPADGESGVWRDIAVVAWISAPIDPATVGRGSLVVEAGEGSVDGELSLSPDGLVVLWRPLGPLEARVRHRVTVRELCDRRGRTLEPYETDFWPCDLTHLEVLKPD
jgi:hypothetical protein